MIPIRSMVTSDLIAVVVAKTVDNDCKARLEIWGWGTFPHPKPLCHTLAGTRYERSEIVPHPPAPLSFLLVDALPNPGGRIWEGESAVGGRLRYEVGGPDVLERGD